MGLGFTWLEKLDVWRWTNCRRISEYGLEDMSGFDHLTDKDVDEIVKGFVKNHGGAT